MDLGQHTLDGDIIKLKKLTTTKTNCKEVKGNVFWLICLLLLLKSLIETPQIITEISSPNINE